MIYMMPGLPDPSIPLWKLNFRKGAYLELFQAIESLESTFIEVDKSSNMIWSVRLFKSQIQNSLSWKDIIPSNNEVFIDFESYMALGT